MRPQAQWYEAEEDDHRFLDPVNEAFKDAVSIFNSTITNDVEKQTSVLQATSLEDFQRTVTDARLKYDNQHNDHKIRKWLTKCSYRIRYYGNIMDVLVQHHPEYVSLAWGAVKLLFVLVQNQARLVHTLAKGLSQIADSLPRTELATILYPTKRMKQAVAELFAHIIRFFIRAQNWYQQSKLRHTWESLVRPAELRYDDLISDIERCTKEVDDLATTGARAEQRDIHLELQELSKRQRDSNTVLLEMRQLLVSYQSLNSSSHLNTNQQLADLQLNQIMDYLSNTGRMDPLKCLQYCTLMSNKRGLANNPRAIEGDSHFWLHPKFVRWQSRQGPALIMVKGDYKSRFEAKRFCVNIVGLLRKSNIPVIWTLKTRQAEDPHGLSVVEVMKDLVCQALRLNLCGHTERFLSLSCAQFREAETEDQWFNLLAMVVATLPSLYIIVDIEAVNITYAKRTQDFSWLSAFQAMFQELSKRQFRPTLKVVLVSYGSATVQESRLAEFQDLVVLIRQPRSGSLFHRGKAGGISRLAETTALTTRRRSHRMTLQ